MIRMFRPYYLSSRVIPALAAALLLVAPVAARVDDGTLFVRSAVENGDGTVTLPLYQGLSGGRTVYYVVLDASSGDTANRLGVNRSQKLANARFVERAPADVVQEERDRAARFGREAGELRVQLKALGEE